MATPFPILNTHRLFLREINLDDLERIYYFRSDPVITQYVKRPPQTLESAKAHIEMIAAHYRQSKSITWGLCLKNSGTLIGTLCLWNFSEDRKTAEVGYDLDPNFQGKGYMREALKKVLDFAFNQCGFETIEAFTDFRNIPSKNLLKALGFIPNNKKKDTENQNNVVFELKC